MAPGSYEIIAYFVAVVLATKYALLRIVRYAAPRSAQTATLTLGLWLAVTAIAAMQNLLAFGSMPPRILLLVGLSAALTLAAAFSRLGLAIALKTPLWALIGLQTFRIFVEIFLHWGHQQGFVPVQMTWESCNLDVLTGVTAIPVAWLAYRGKLPGAGLLAWNCFGLGLLLNIVTVAILSMPTPMRMFPGEPSNVFVTRPPYVWLPVFLVMAALFSHVVLFRRWRDIPR
jgi:hypothetical protein